MQSNHRLNKDVLSSRKSGSEESENHYMPMEIDT
jgi:hypothetical protein